MYFSKHFTYVFPKNLDRYTKACQSGLQTHAENWSFEISGYREKSFEFFLRDFFFLEKQFSKFFFSI